MRDELVPSEIVDTPDDQVNESLGVSVHSGTLHIGPLPSPDTLAQYEAVEPGTANRIISMAENQAAHRMQMDKDYYQLDKKYLESNSRDSFLGVVFAFGIGLATIVCGTVVILAGHSVAGSILSCTGITGIVGTFVYGTRLNKKDKSNKTPD